jgi:ABC-type oligopeptide transport system substrate-binding subunit
LSLLVALAGLVSLTLACNPAPTPETIIQKETVVVKETVVIKETVEVPVEVTVEVVKEVPATESAAPAAMSDQNLIWSVEGVNEMPGLDPANPQNAQSVLALNLIFGGLVRLDAQLNVIPDGAESWQVSEDGKTYTFTIREELKFADGAPATAQDFADSINRALQPETASYGASFQLQHVVGATDVAEGKAKTATGVKVVDERTLEITTDDTVPYFLAQLTYPVTFAVPLKFVEEKGAAWMDQAYGTGPFRVKEIDFGAESLLLGRSGGGRPGRTALPARLGDGLPALPHRRPGYYG